MFVSVHALVNKNNNFVINTNPCSCTIITLEKKTIKLYGGFIKFVTGIGEDNITILHVVDHSVLEQKWIDQYYVCKVVSLYIAYMYIASSPRHS